MARQAYDYAQIVMRPLEPWERQSLKDLRDCVGRWHEKAVAKGYDGVESMCDTAPAQAQQAHWTPEQVLRTQEIAAELKVKIKHKPLTEQEVAEAVFDYYQHFSDPQEAAEAHFDKDLAMFRLAERACAEAWGVKLAGIGASMDGKKVYE